MRIDYRDTRLFLEYKDSIENQFIEEQSANAEQRWAMYLRHGPIALLSVSPASTYQYYYRQLSKRCKEACGRRKNRQCFNLCYSRSAARVLARVRSDMGRLNQIDAPKKREKLKMKLEEQMEKWSKQVDKYEQLARIQT